jgi:hypothetical protein
VRYTTKAAINELEELIKGAQEVANEGSNSPAFMRWYLRAATFLEEVFGPASRYYIFFKAMKFYASGGFVIQAWDIQAALDERHAEGFIDGLNKCIGIFEACIDELERNPISKIYRAKDTPKESSTLIKVMTLADRKLRKVVRNLPQREKDIQDAFENLLIGADISYHREHPHIAYSSKTYVPDFTFEKIDLALDVKLCAKTTREKEMIAELNDDIMAYKTKFGNVMFVIYDVGMIRDVDRFTSEFKTRDDVIITIIKH